MEISFRLKFPHINRPKILVVALLSTVVYFISRFAAPDSLQTLVLKCVPNILFIYLIYQSANSHSLTTYAQKVTTGLCWATLGDCLIGSDESWCFGIGVVCFCVAHVMYMGAFGFHPVNPGRAKQVYGQALLALLFLAGVKFSRDEPYFIDFMVQVTGCGLYLLFLFGSLWRASAGVQSWSRMHTWLPDLRIQAAFLWIIDDIILILFDLILPIRGAWIAVMTSYYLGNALVAVSAALSNEEAVRGGRPGATPDGFEYQRLSALHNIPA